MPKSAHKCRKVSKRWDFIVLVVLFAHAKRGCVSPMLDFFYTSTGDSVSLHLKLLILDKAGRRKK